MKESDYTAQFLSELESCALQAILRAGDLLKEGFHSTHFDVKEKTNTHDLVTEYDVRAEKAIIEVLKDYFPKHSILGEESGYKKNSSDGITWVIDPIDGTWNFARQIPCFGSSIAAMHNETILLGMILDPIANELFIAKKGFGSTRNGRKIHTSSIAQMDRAGISLGFSLLCKEIQEISLIRKTGSTVLDMCYVAKGALEAFIDGRQSLWDFAAAKLIIEEAGGIVSNLQGHPLKLSFEPQKYQILASNSQIFKELVQWTSMVKK